MRLTLPTKRVDLASIAAFRIGFGLLMCVSALRFLASGWVERFYEQPEMFFSYWGLAWVQPLPAPWMHAVVAGQAVFAFGMAAGAFFRVSCIGFLLLFGWTELIDVTTYLNHYYLASLLTVLLAVSPAHRMWSVDAWRRPETRQSHAPAWTLFVLRFQVAVVYVFAAVAKLQSDWLVHAQPLRIWFKARTEVPVVGVLFEQLWFAHAASWGAFVFEVAVVPALLWRRTRWWAFGVVVLFHGGTHLLFEIGIFPFLMPLAATLLLDASWPRWSRIEGQGQGQGQVEGGIRWVWVGVGLWCLLQVLVPLRGLGYGSDVLWGEQGMRWSWKVMVREKHGAVTYRVRPRGNADVELLVSPERYLDGRQTREMAAQPDLILQLAHRIASDFGPGTEVRADALASLNGRRAARLIDPDVDLARVSDGLGRADWILPRPAEAPPSLEPSRVAQR